MSEFKGMTRHGRRVRFAAMIVGAALALPSLAVANHTTCTKQANEPGAGVNCPEFSPNLTANTGSLVVDAETGLNLEISQADHESTLSALTGYAPKGWQLNTEIRPAAIAGACSGSAEVLSNDWRLRYLSGANRAATELVGALYFDAYDAGAQTISACARVGSFTLPVAIQKLAASHPYAATAGWAINVNLESVRENTALRDASASVTRIIVDIRQRTGGTWNQNLSGQFEKAIFSRASATPVTTDLRADATTCRRGLDNATTSGCVLNDTLTVLLKTEPFNISPAPTGAPVDFGHLSGPTRLAGTTVDKVGGTYRRDGYGLVKGSTTATVTWTAPPPGNPDETVKGYALIVALPNDQGSRYGQYLLAPAVSAVLTPGLMPRIDGTGSLDPNFDGVSKYDLALITIYASGKRTDGLCDNGTAFGALCPATTPLWFVKTSAHPDGFDLPVGHVGTSYWQFLWRTKTYDTVTMETNFRGNGNGTADDETEPFMLLFVNYTTKEGELVIWGSYTKVNNLTTSTRTLSAGRASEGPGTSFKSRSNLITGQGATGVVAFSNGASPTGTALRFDFAGETGPAGTYGLISMLEPGDIVLGNSIPPTLSGRRPMSIATRLMQATRSV